jgi:hypothetical protein
MGTNQEMTVKEIQSKQIPTRDKKNLRKKEKRVMKIKKRRMWFLIDDN